MNSCKLKILSFHSNELRNLKTTLFFVCRNCQIGWIRITNGYKFKNM